MSAEKAGPDLVYLLTPGGLVLGMTVPLSGAIAEQLERGYLARVNEDGTPFGEEAGAPLPPADDTPDPEPSVPARPSSGAAKKEWVDHVVSSGLAPADEAGQMTKAELVALADQEFSQAEEE